MQLELEDLEYQRRAVATVVRGLDGQTKDTAANLGFEAKLWLAADNLHNNMNAAEYMHLVLDLIFLKYSKQL